MITTDTKYNFLKAENDTFSWSYFDGARGDYLTHKATGNRIYQMRWETNWTPVDSDTRDKAIAFWAELKVLQDAKPEPVVDTEPEPEHGVNGYCQKCHSYCWGDCEAN